MAKYSRVLLALIGATVVLGATVGTASAALSTSSQTIRAVWREIVLRSAFTTSNCNVTLEGSLHSRTIIKSIGSLIGYVTRADLGACASGRVTILRATLPWHIRYDSFAGTLPNIVSRTVTIKGASIALTFPECLFRTTTAEPATATFNRNASGELVSVTTGGTIRTACGPVTLSGTSTSTVLNSAAKITLTLI